MRLNQPVSLTRWFLIEISHDDQRTRDILESSQQLFSFKHSPIFVLIVEMCGDKVQFLAVKSHFRADEAAAFGFAQIFVKPVIRRENRLARKNGDAILSALILQIKGERVIHLCELREFDDLIDPLRTFNAAIDLLQADEIGLLLINDFSDAREVELLVHADAHVDVVGHHAESLCKTSGDEDKEGGENRSAKKKTRQSTDFSRASPTTESPQLKLVL